MTPISPSEARPLPSPQTLQRGGLLALAVAVLLGATVVLPAETGHDPTGAGRLLGLAQMGAVKAALAEEAREDAAVTQRLRDQARTALAAPAPTASRADSVTLTVPPGRHAEALLVAQRGAQVAFRWATARGTLAFDVHGNTTSGTDYHRYASGTAWADQGAFTATTDGLHGWSWHNEGDAPITVTLHAEGDHLALLAPGAEREEEAAE